MKEEVDGVIQKYGAEQPPPPAQLFTLANRPGKGNVHVVQKVFRGAFEVHTLPFAFAIHCLQIIV